MIQRVSLQLVFIGALLIGLAQVIATPLLDFCFALAVALFPLLMLLHCNALRNAGRTVIGLLLAGQASIVLSLLAILPEGLTREDSAGAPIIMLLGLWLIPLVLCTTAFVLHFGKWNRPRTVSGNDTGQ